MGGLEAWAGPGVCPEGLDLRLGIFKLDESTNSAICLPTVFLFLTPEKYSLPQPPATQLVGGGGRDDYGQGEGNTEGQWVGEWLVSFGSQQTVARLFPVSFIHATKGY